MIHLLQQYIKSFWELFYPNVCLSCGNHLNHQEKTICLVCLWKLPYTNFHLLNNNPLEKKLKGRIAIDSINSLLFFEKASNVQHLLHQLKYRQKEEVGRYLAQLVVEQLPVSKNQPAFDCIVQVPLHPAKLKARGYNQCTAFSTTLSKEWNIPFYPNVLVRKVNTKSQTGKSRANRWENVKDIFQVENPSLIHNKKILLIDDVITTGATLEACGHQLIVNKISSLHILTMACKI